MLFEDHALEGRPGLHALLIGVSDDPNLPPVSVPASLDAGPPDFGLRSLTGAASSADRLAQWLINHRDCFNVPLATCRLLISPSAAERAANPSLRNCVEKVDLTHAATAAREWQECAAKHPDNIAFFYFAGHGLQRRAGESVTDQVLLLSEFGDTQNTIFHHSFSAEDLIKSMAPGRPATPVAKIARTQYFLFDACRSAPKALYEQYDSVPCSALFDVFARTSDDNRRILVLHAAEAASNAYSHPGGFTYLNEALLKCLNGGVGERDRVIDLQRPRWNVTAGELERGIDYYLQAESIANRVFQRAVVSGNLPVNTVFCRLNGPPTLPLTVLLNPASSCQHTQVQFHDDRDGMARPLSPPINPHPHTFSLEAGIYHYHYRCVVDGSATDFLTDNPSSPFSHEKPGIVYRITI